MIRLFILKNNFEKKKIDDSNTSSILSKNCNCMPPLLHNVSLQFSYFMINAISPSYLFVARQNFWLNHIVTALSIPSTTHIATHHKCRFYYMIQTQEGPIDSL